MALNFDKALGIHADALLLRAKRSEAIAANIANVDTPNYKARDIDFAAALEKASAARTDASSGVQLQRSNALHLDVSGNASGTALQAELLYRIPHQSSMDGNTVEAHRENAAFTENALQYQASLRFLGGKFQSIKDAITGGR